MRIYKQLPPTFEDRRDWTLPRILRARAASHGDRPYLDVPASGVTLTYAETLAMAEGIARSLVALGAEPGDRMLIMSANCAEYILSWFGASLAGMAEVPINTAYSGSFLEHQVRTVAPRFAVIAPEFAERFLEGGDAFAALERFFVLGEGAETEAAVAALRGAGWEAAPYASLTDGGLTSAADLPDPSYTELASIFFTSGTTGLSKGVMMSHSQMTFFAEQCVSLTRLGDEDVYMSVGPLFHGNAQFLAAYPALIAGARFVLRERFSASRWVPWLRESGATVTNFVGVMMDFTYKQPPSPDDPDNALRCVYAAPTAASIVADFKQRFGVEAFVENFGLTETSMPIMSPYGEDRPAGAAGLICGDWFDVRLVDPETDEEVPVGEVGELVVRAHVPWTMSSGYYGMPDKTAETYRNLWFHTGDGMRRDEDGWFYFVDRLKDAIRRRGENISSYEVEQAVLGHELVAECAAVAAPAAVEAGEDEVALFVVAARPARRWTRPRSANGATGACRSSPCPSTWCWSTSCRRRRRGRSARSSCAIGSSPRRGRALEPRRPDGRLQRRARARRRGRLGLRHQCREPRPRHPRQRLLLRGPAGPVRRRAGPAGGDRRRLRDRQGRGRDRRPLVPGGAGDPRRDRRRRDRGARQRGRDVREGRDQPGERGCRQCGVEVGMTVADAARAMLENDPQPQAPSEITNRTVMLSTPDGGAVICTDSIAFGTEEDRDRNVLCTAGHTGRSAVPYLRKVSPRGFICSDGGRGLDDSGIAGLDIVGAEGLAGATVDARTARMGDGLSTYLDGVISACNAPARERGVEVGQPAREAAALLLGVRLAAD